MLKMCVHLLHKKSWQLANSVVGQLVEWAHTDRLAADTADLAVAGIVDTVVADYTAVVNMAAAGIARGSDKAAADTVDIDLDSGRAVHMHLPAAALPPVLLRSRLA